MLSFFKPRPPLTTGQRVNLDLLMRRTIEAIGSDLPKRCEVVSNIEHLSLDSSTPERMLDSAGTEIRRRFPDTDAIVQWSISRDENLQLPSVYHASTESSAAQLQIHATTLGDPLRTVAELANQYSNHYWHSSGKIDSNGVHPNLSHLLPICCGLGVLASDAAFYDSQLSAGGWHRWSMSRSGFYNATEIGYASALLARHRTENDPAWFSSMRLDSRATAKKALRYFADCDQKRRPILFDALKVPSSRCDPQELTAWWQGNDPAFALAAAYALLKQGTPSSRVIGAAIHVANGASDDLVPFAIRLLGRSPVATGEVRALIERSIAHKNHAISIQAILSADALGMPLSPFRKRIAGLLESYAEGSNELVELVGKGGAEFGMFDVVICQHLAEAVVYENDAAIVSLVDCLHQICSDPKSVVEREIGDPELKGRILTLLDG